jgi:ribose-phosphate pyrophosphokinase
MNVIFSMREYVEHFQNPLLGRLDHSTRGQIQREVYPDGEVGLRLLTPVRGEDVILIGSTHTSQATLELYDLACAIAKYGARSLTLIVPYFGCSTMERATHEGDVVRAKTRARLLSSIPQTAVGNRILLLDLHSEGIPHYFEGDLTATHVYAKPVIHEHVRKVAKTFAMSDTILASTDAGRAKWVESLANDLRLSAAFIIKKRLSGSETRVAAVGGADVKGKLVILYDDMIRSGGSLLSAARAYRDAGAAEVTAVATHGVFTVTPPVEETVKLLTGSRYKTDGPTTLSHLAVTNSHPNVMGSWALASGMSVLDVSHLFLPYLRNVSH